MAMKTGDSLFQRLKPLIYMIMLQFGYSGMYILSVATLKQGMNHYVLVVYRNLVAVAVISPFALLFERKKRPKITLRIFLKIVAMAVLEPVLDQNFYYMGTKVTGASFSAAFYNILPAITFIIAIIIRIEKINIRRRHSQAKIIGAAITMFGAFLMILYNGPIVEFFWSKGQVHHDAAAAAGSASQGESFVLLKGACMLLVSCISWALFFIVQANTLESYPAELTLTIWICSMGALLSSLVALVMERGSIKPWIIGFDTRLFTAFYAGIVCSGIAYYVQGIVMQERGPVYCTAFSPLTLIITAFTGSIILAEEITLGRIIGAAIIVIGVYSLIWGKSNEHLPSKAGNSSMKGETELPVAMTTSNFIKTESSECPTLVEIPVMKHAGAATQF